MWGVGERTARIFDEANLYFLEDLRESAQQVQAVITQLQRSSDRSPSYWRAMGTRCDDVIYRARSATRVKQIDPEHLTCMLTATLFEDPVIAPSGHTFEKWALLEWLERNPTDPMTREPLTKDQLYPNRAVLEAVDDYKRNYAEYLKFT
jgi:hypothetical protein